MLRMDGPTRLQRATNLNRQRLGSQRLFVSSEPAMSPLRIEAALASTAEDVCFASRKKRWRSIDEIAKLPADDARPGMWLQLRLDRSVPGCARPIEAKLPQFGQNCDLVEPAVVAVFGCYEGCSSARAGAMNEREELLSKLKRYSTLRDLISDERAVTVIGELIIQIEVRLAQIENIVRDQTPLRPTLGEVRE
jgi:hypothetical protein